MLCGGLGAVCIEQKVLLISNNNSDYIAVWILLEFQCIIL